MNMSSARNSIPSGSMVNAHSKSGNNMGSNSNSHQTGRRSRQNSGIGDSPAGGGDGDGYKVDFIQRTMMEREASGKRKIKPTYCADTLFAEDSDDPDFDVDQEDSISGSDSGEKGGSTSNSNSSDDSSEDDDGDDESEDDKDSSRSSAEEGSSDSGSDSDQSVTKKPKNSVLRDYIEKMKDSSIPVIRKKKKAKPKIKPAPTKPNISEFPDSIMATINSVISHRKVNDHTLSSSKPKSLTNGTLKSKKKNSQPEPGSSKPKKENKRKKVKSVKTKESKKRRVTKKTKKNKKQHFESLSQLVADCDNQLAGVRSKMTKLKHSVCAICLNDQTNDSNEIVECDCCKITCHEECYNVLDDDDSASSPSITAPWFCDACKSGRTDIYCELCPNIGGLFKETISGTWVHKLCAMYTPGANSGGQKINADISTIPDSKWGAKECVVCPDERLARIGIPVKCDAAMCKEYFHISCGQKLGLLSDPLSSSLETMEADPLFITCKAHLSSDLRKKQAECYKVLQEQTRYKRLRRGITDVRILEKLETAREEYSKQFRLNIDNSIVVAGEVVIPFDSVLPGDPVPKKRARLLDNSAYSVLTNDRKVDYTHYDKNAILLQEKHENIVLNAKKMWNVSPGLTVAFSAYYHDRNRRINELEGQREQAKNLNTTFCKKELELNGQLESKAMDKMELSDEHLKLTSEYDSLRNILAQLGSAHLPSKQKKTPIRKSKSPASSITKKNSQNDNKSELQSKSIAKKSPKVGILTIKRSSCTNKVVSPVRAATEGRLSLNRCIVCKKTEKQHLIILCDKCKNYYHCGCLDPPLTKKPRVTQKCGWMCADCDEKDKEEEDEESEVDVDAPRALRGRNHIKKPVKYLNESESDDDFFILKAERLERMSPVLPSKPTRVKKPRQQRNRHRVPKSRVTKSEKNSMLPIIKLEKTSPVKQTVHDPDPFTVHMSDQSPSASVVITASRKLNGSTTPVKVKKGNTKKSQEIDTPMFLSSGYNLTNFTRQVCDTCKKSDFSKNVVRCDKCNLDFHFACLNPPLKYTPKRRGFKWFCSDCDDAASHSSDDGISSPLGLANGIK